MTPPIDESPYPLLMVVTGLLISVIMAALSTYITPQLALLYTNFGAELPAVTNMALNYYGVAWLLPIIVLCVAMMWPNRESCGMISMVVGAVGSIVLFLATQAAAYLPVLTMGAVVK